MKKVADVREVKIGDKVKIVANTNGHNAKVGEMYAVAGVYPESRAIIVKALTGTWQSNYVGVNDFSVGFASRNEEADYIKKTIASSKKKITALERRLYVIENFENDREALAHDIGEICGAEPKMVLELLEKYDVNIDSTLADA